MEPERATNSDTSLSNIPVVQQQIRPFKSVKSAERYAPKFKAKVLKYLREGDGGEEEATDNTHSPHANRPAKCKYGKKTVTEAAKKFKVHPSTISDWAQSVKRQSELKGSTTKITLMNNSYQKETKNETTRSNSKTGDEKIQNHIVTILKNARVEGEPLTKQTDLGLLREKLMGQIKEIILTETVKGNDLADKKISKNSSWYENWWSRFSSSNISSTSVGSEGEAESGTDFHGGAGASSLHHKRTAVSSNKSF